MAQKIKNLAEDMEMQTIKEILESADMKQSSSSSFKYADSKFTKAKEKIKIREFNRAWRLVFGYQCSGFSFYSLLTVFHRRYGIPSNWHNQPQPWPANPVKDDEEEEEIVRNVYLDAPLIEEILARLPVPSLMRAKSVCKAWNSAISGSPSFWSLCNSLYDVKGQYLAAHHKTQSSQAIVLFSPSLNRWFRIPLQWRGMGRVRGKGISRKENNNFDLDFNYPLHLCAAGGGFFLFWNRGGKYENRLLVFSPITKQHVVLPPFPLHHLWQSGMAVELITHQSSDQFKVIVIADSYTEPWTVCPVVYDSSRDKWTMEEGKSTSTHTSVARSHNRTSVLDEGKGVMYCTSDYGHHVGCYYIANGEFKFMEIEGGLPPQVDYRDSDRNPLNQLPSLVMCSGRLILAGRLWQKSKRDKPIFGRLPLIKHYLVGLWELNLMENSKSWSLISVSPRDLLEVTVESSDGTDFLIVASDGTDQIWFMLRGSMKLLMFNLSSARWSLLPGCPGEDVMDTSSRRAFCTSLKISPLVEALHSPFPALRCLSIGSS